MTMRRVLRWVLFLWSITLPVVLVAAWVLVERCMATTPEDDCGIVYMLPAAWLVPWLIGLAVLALGLVIAGTGTEPRD
jgi:hypothetical protein